MLGCMIDDLAVLVYFFFFQAEDGIRDLTVTGVQTCALPICAPATTTATIANVLPAVNPGANQTITLGGSFALSTTFDDPGVNDAPWPYAIDWGDGSPQTTGSTTSQSNPITAAHTYAAAGTDTVRITVTDKDGAAGSGQGTDRKSVV